MKRVYRKREQTAEQKEAERRIRDEFQRTKPTLSQILSSGEFTPPMLQSEYLELQLACREKLRPLRESAGLTLTQMAERTGMDRAAINKLENGVHGNPTISTINRYLQALGKRMVVQIVDAHEPVEQA